MRKDWKYILYVSLAIGIFVMMKLLSPKQYDWTVTLAHDDKNPYGTYALHTLLPSLVDSKKIIHSYQTLYELKDSLLNDNILIVTSTFNTGAEDTEVLLSHVAAGATALISAQHVWGKFADTLKIETSDYFFNNSGLFTNDTSYIQFANQHLDTTSRYWYKRDNIYNYFSSFDSTRTTVIARNDQHQPVTIRVQWGKGQLILNSTPLIFTNIYLLSGKNYDLISHTLSYLPKQDLQWTEYYHVGRLEATTPLRFILTTEPLRWAYYITIISVFVFILFEAKRKQRIIPVMKPLANTTLEFVSTIGNLYYERADHKNIAEKKINFFLEQLRSQYLLATTHLDERFVKTLANKSGREEQQVETLVKTINFILSCHDIAAEHLMELTEQIQNFNNQ